MGNEVGRSLIYESLRTVREDEIVPLPELAKRLGLGQSAVRAARRQGLKVRRIGRRKFILGRDLVAFLESRPPS
jgi:hypothetical protein